jgi:hypothetical protein
VYFQQGDHDQARGDIAIEPGFFVADDSGMLTKLLPRTAQTGVTMSTLDADELNLYWVYSDSGKLVRWAKP